MPLQACLGHCIWCSDQITSKRPERALRQEISCIEEPPPQTTGPKRRGIYVCPKATCQSQMLPQAEAGVFEEWSQFHVTRKLVTTMKLTGLTTSQAFAQIRSAEALSGHRWGMQILNGLENVYEQGRRKIYDPEFEDPAFFHASVTLTLALAEPGLFWFATWVMLMRFNREINSKVLVLWDTKRREEFDDILATTSMSSITTRGNEPNSLVQTRCWQLRLFFSSEDGRRIGKEQMEEFRSGRPLPGSV